MNWIKSGIAAAVIAAGCMMWHPGEEGRQSAGMVLVIAGLSAVSSIMAAARKK